MQDGDIYHYHLDHLGTPRELTSEAGEIVWKVKYHTYGNVALKETEEIENNLRFQGQYFDEESGLHYNRHRYYNPHTGQFISQDPIGLLGGINNYQYAPNPTGWIDPLGLCKEAPEEPGLEGVFPEELLLGGVLGILGKAAKGIIGAIVAKSAGNTVVRTTRAGDKAIRTTRPDGSVIDISPKRVKEFVPNTNPNAPSGALNRVKFDNGIPGSKGFKRPPTQLELDILNNAK